VAGGAGKSPASRHLVGLGLLLKGSFEAPNQASSKTAMGRLPPHADDRIVRQGSAWWVSLWHGGDLSDPRYWRFPGARNH